MPPKSGKKITTKRKSHQLNGRRPWRVALVSVVVTGSHPHSTSSSIRLANAACIFDLLVRTSRSGGHGARGSGALSIGQGRGDLRLRLAAAEPRVVERGQEDQRQQGGDEEAAHDGDRHRPPEHG